jgi:pimeloyl-ACP methyl ester carboxylesterase
MTLTPSTRTVTVDAGGVPVPVTFTERGEGRPVLLLHGGAGPQSVEKFAALLAEAGPARVIVPVHPGFGGTPRPDQLASMSALAAVYGQLIDDLGLAGVTVVGNSIGGWIAAEIALLASPRVSGAVLVDAAGLQLADAPAADFFALTMDQVADLAYYRPDDFRIDVASLPDQARAAMAGNQAALAVYGGAAMADAGLLGRLPAITIPVLVVWGAADRMIPPAHGRAYAAAIPGASFRLITEAGHLPQLETPGELLQLVTEFAGAPAAADGPAGS